MRIAAAATVGTALALTAAACASSSSSSSTSAPASTASASGTTSAAAVPAADNLKAAGCPSTIVLQTDWNPEAEHGGQYELVGPNPTINSSAKSVTGELVAHGGIDTGVQIQIRAGGPAIGYQTVSLAAVQGLLDHPRVCRNRRADRAVGDAANRRGDGRP